MLGRVVGRGGFGATYVGLDIKDYRRCAIKEYLPSEYASRETGTRRVIPNAGTKAQAIFSHGRGKFLDEARALQKFRTNPIVVDIWGYFEENNTAYIVMEYLDGQDLQKMSAAWGGKLDPDFALNLFKIIASALMNMHTDGMLHRDLKPENIFYTKDGRCKLFDFGSARDYIRAEKMGEGMSVLLTPGYAPPEQYSKAGHQGPWTDIYALCATFYKLVSGQKPKDGLLIAKGVKQPTLAEMGCAVSKTVSDVIRKGMEPEIKKRYQNFKEVLDDMEEKRSPNPKPRPKPHPKPRPKPKPHPEPDLSGGGKEITQSRRDDPPPPKRRAVVTVLLGDSAGAAKEIPAGRELVIGRNGDECQLVIGRDANVSRVHCKVRFDEKGQTFYVTDVSSNGTYFEDGKRMIKNKSYSLRAGARFYLSSTNNMLKVDITE